VIPLRKAGRIECLAAFVIPQDDVTEAGFEVAQRLRRALAERLPGYMLPRVLHTVASFPMTPNGKVDRTALAAELG
jgi:D-alanine--poly(phosphoribitol) ligase subunit 1